MNSSAISSGQLNSSSSKMKYSFPKSQRFEMKRYDTPSPNKFYQLPDIKSKRSTGFGYGNKIDMSKQNFKSPGPDAYRSYSSFDLKSTKGFSMAEGREKIKAGDMFYESFKRPSPFEYNPQKTNRSLSFSMSDRHPDLTDRWIKSVPGPGTYTNIKVTNEQAKSSLAKYISAPSTKFGRSLRKSQAQVYNPKTPGSNLYVNSSQLSKKFTHKSGNKFSRALRPSMANNKPIPGPGAYNRMSQFG